MIRQDNNIRRGLVSLALIGAATLGAVGNAAAEIPVSDATSGSSGSANVCHADPIDGHTVTCLPAPIDFLLRLLSITGSTNTGSWRQLQTGSATTNP